MKSIDNDPELASEIISLLTRELKSVRQQLQASSGSISKRQPQRHEDEIRDWKERAVDAEHSLITLSEAYDKLKELHESTAMQASADTQSASTTEKVTSLTTALEKQREKYRSEKVARKELSAVNKELRKEILNLQSRMATQEVVPKDATLTQSLRRREIESYLSSFPDVPSRPPNQELLPVCQRNVNLEAFLALDPTLRATLGQYLFLPGRLVWSTQLTDHAFGVAPSFLYHHASEKRHWERNDAFSSLWGKTMHLFFTNDSLIYYAGMYEALDMRSWGSGLIKELSKHNLTDVVAEAAIKDGADKNMQRHIQTLLRDNVLTIDILGLRCVAFDTALYETLHQRFLAVTPASSPKAPKRLHGGHGTANKNLHKRRRM